ncbi:kinase-like domain-containing protein, partial [Flammula alnicola]
MSSNTDDDSSIADTDTSTVIHSQEPFETYQEKVVLLIQSLFPLHPASGISVTRARGGTFNRIIAVSLKSLSSANEEHYILRVPRNEDQMDLLLRQSSIPIPEVVHCDATSDNPLQGPYILMRRLEGENLAYVLPQLDHRQRLSMARAIARLIAKVHTFNVPSGLGPLYTRDGNLVVGRFLKHNNVDGADTSYIPPRTMHDFFSSRFIEFLDEAAEQRDDFLVTYCGHLLSASETLLRGFSTPASGTNVLYHPDFARRNILVRQNEATQDWEVSGLVDWDGCQVAPAEIAYLCPGWLWTSPDDPIVMCATYELDWDPDRPVSDDKYSAVKEAFVNEIEELLPGFMDVVRSTRKHLLKKL